MLFASAVVIVAGIEFIRWQVFETNAAQASSLVDTDVPRLAPLEASLVDLYRVNHDWSFLPADPAQRRSWLSEQFTRSDPSPRPNSLERRLGLFDATNQLRSRAVA